jgi:hypothetical protein
MMNDITTVTSILGKPYAITRSRLGAISRIFGDKYVCDSTALHELFQSISEKLSSIQASETPKFSFLISFSDKTHHDGVTSDLNQLVTIPIGKQTERVILRWVIPHKIENIDNELSVTIRISNPINPLVFLQAALSKSPDEVDNMEFETGSTCVTVDGATQNYADEIFLRIQNWMNARNKPHAFVDIDQIYKRYEWHIDQLNVSLFPLAVISALSLYCANSFNYQEQLTIIPILMGSFFVLQSFGRRLNINMAKWARRTMHISMFQLTNGDNDFLTKMTSRAKNNFLKLTSSGIFSILLNVFSAYLCWRFLKI